MSDLKDQIPIAETFYSAQGEGPYVGKPSVFLRCSFCNLSCPRWGTPGSPTGCDTTAVWSRVWRRWTPEELIVYWQENGWVYKLSSGAHLILTGGEPTLWQPLLVKLLYELDRSRGDGTRREIFTEVETNGTLPITGEGEDCLDSWVQHYNCSPKLRSAGNPIERAYVPKVLEWYAHKTGKAIFKFVIQDPQQDVDEIKDNYLQPFGIHPDRVWLMPQASTRAELVENSARVMELCKEHGFNFSSRLQLHIWDRATGV